MEDAVWMEMRREMERLKATVAELGRRIEDQADAEATPLRVEAGNGIEVQESGGAYRVSAAAATAESDFPYGDRWAFGIEFFEDVVEEETLPHARIHNVVTRTGQIYATGGPLEVSLGAGFSGMLFLVVDWDQYPSGSGLFALKAVAEDPGDPGVVDPAAVAAPLGAAKELVPLYWISGTDIAVDFIHGAHSGHGWIPTDFDDDSSGA
jgi:hypothetical protein